MKYFLGYYKCALIVKVMLFSMMVSKYKNSDQVTGVSTILVRGIVHKYHTGVKRLYGGILTTLEWKAIAKSVHDQYGETEWE